MNSEFLELVKSFHNDVMVNLSHLITESQTSGLTQYFGRKEMSGGIGSAWCALLKNEFVNRGYISETDSGNDNSRDFFAIVNDDVHYLECKCSHDVQYWRGGEYSKRGGWYVLISWRLNKIDNEPEFFIVLIHAEEKDFISSKSSNYYGTTLGKKFVESCDNKFVLTGNIHKKRLKSGTESDKIVIEYEKISLDNPVLV